MPWLSDLSRHFKLYRTNLIFSPLVGANIAYVLNSRGILALPSFGKRVSSFTLLWQHSSSATTTTTQPFIQFPREVIVNSIFPLQGIESQLGPSWWRKLLTAGVKLPETKAGHDMTKNKKISSWESPCASTCADCVLRSSKLRRDLKCATSHCAHFFLLFWAV